MTRLTLASFGFTLLVTSMTCMNCPAQVSSQVGPWTQAGDEYVWINRDSVIRKGDGLVYYRFYMGPIRDVDHPSFSISEFIDEDRINCLEKLASTFKGSWQEPRKMENKTILKIVCFAPTLESAKNGDVQAQYELGEMYWDGIGTSVDYQQAMHWLRAAADMGNAAAMPEIGVMYGQGLGVEKDVNEALKWYQRGAERGNPHAESEMGWAIEHGLGTSKDYQVALTWYRKAARHGYKTAKDRLRELGETE